MRSERQGPTTQGIVKGKLHSIGRCQGALESPSKSCTSLSVHVWPGTALLVSTFKALLVKNHDI